MKTKQSTEIEFKEPNYSFWASKPYWSIDEAAALIIGNNPDIILQQSDEILETFTLCKQAINHAQEQDMLTSPMRPIQLVEFFSQVSKLGVPPKLRKAVMEYTSDPERSFGVLAKSFEALKRENDRLQRQFAEQKALDPRERKTLLLLLCGLVHHHYRYDPEKKKGVPTDIKLMLASMKIKLSDDVIRSWLNAAFELLPDDQFDTLGSLKKK